MSTSSRADDEETLALCLYTVWALHTGRPIPERPYGGLTRAELEDFWSDHDLDEPRDDRASS